MNPTADAWAVIDHDAGVLTLAYPFTRNAYANTFAARLPDGGMMVISPSVGLTDALAEALTAYGPVTALVANNGLHHLGLAGWQARFPDAVTYAADEAAARITGRSPDLDRFHTLQELETHLGAHIAVRAVTHGKMGELWARVTTRSGHVWFVSDILANMPALPQALPQRWMFKLSGSAPGYRIFHLSLFFQVSDKRAALQELYDEMTARPPTAIVPSHGDLLTEGDLLARTQALLAPAL